MFYIKKIITPFILPPGIFILVLGIICIWSLTKKRPRTALLSFAMSFVLYIFSIGPIADLPMRGLESGLKIPSKFDTDVIIMLSGGLYGYSHDLSGIGAPGPFTMERLVTAARVHFKTGAPIIVSGGQVYEHQAVIAPAVKRFLMDLGIAEKMIILESRSRDTYENALYSKQICEKREFSKPVLVTNGYHMKRSLLSFKKVGMTVTPLACGLMYWPNKKYGWTSYLPRADHFRTASTGLHEWIGLIYYRYRY
ncbi:MAG: YdcF family protein [Desulfobacteraceae bacterium]|nr:YdcF family protein [Desulfobacteraceae bacterium]